VQPAGRLHLDAVVPPRRDPLGHALQGARVNMRARRAAAGSALLWGVLLAGCGVGILVSWNQVASIFELACVLAPLAPGFWIVATAQALDASRREQALVALLPGVPAGAALNRLLVTRLSFCYLTVVLMMPIALGVIGAVLTWAQVPLRWSDLHPKIVVAPLVCLPLTGLLWKDWSRAKPLTRLHDTVAIHGLPMGVAAAVVWFGGWTSLLLTAAVSVLATGLWCAWRWRQLETLPSALPAGRR
jgi:hypothetical protein